VRQKMNLYPAFLNLSGKRCVVIGGGAVAERKIQKLLDAGAQVTVVSPVISDQISVWLQAGYIQLVARHFQDDDIRSFMLVVAATNDREVNAHIVRLCDALGKLVNCVDQPQLGSFVVPAVVVHGKVQVAISTSGTNPSRAKGLKNNLLHDLARGTADFISELRKQGEENS